MEQCRRDLRQPRAVATNVLYQTMLTRLYASCPYQLREAAKKEEKRQQKRRSESNASKERLRSKQKTLLLDFGRSSGGASSKDSGGVPTCSGSSEGGAMLESMPWEVLWQVGLIV